MIIIYLGIVTAVLGNPHLDPVLLVVHVWTHPGGVGGSRASHRPRWQSRAPSLGGHSDGVPSDGIEKYIQKNVKTGCVTGYKKSCAKR